MFVPREKDLRFILNAVFHECSFLHFSVSFPCGFVIL